MAQVPTVLITFDKYSSWTQQGRPLFWSQKIQLLRCLYRLIAHPSFVFSWGSSDWDPWRSSPASLKQWRSSHFWGFRWPQSCLPRQPHQDLQTLIAPTLKNQFQWWQKITYLSAMSLCWLVPCLNLTYFFLLWAQHPFHLLFSPFYVIRMFYDF